MGRSISPAKPSSMKPFSSPASRRRTEKTASLFAALVGLILMTALIKWGNPVILDDPSIPAERLSVLPDQEQPTNTRYLLVAVLGLCGIAIADWRIAVPRWLIVLPGFWLTWQFVAATESVDPASTRAALKHFTACVGFFYLGLFVVGRTRRALPLILPLIVGLLVALWAGVGQHYGDLAATREFYLKLYRGEHPPEIQQQHDSPEFRRLFHQPEFQKRLASTRIFGTLVYPNALATAIILLLPASLVTIHQLGRKLPFVAWGVLIGLVAYSGLACLLWSGSKSGWLIALVLGLIAAARLPIQRKIKVAILTTALVCGLIGFATKFADYFGRGAPSVGAGFDYWKAALQIAIANPVLGTGPGTFSVPYARLKAPNSEMAKLVHNDYLEQASDSGFVGFVSYFAWIFGSLAILYRKLNGDPITFSIWLGLLGWALECLVEFALYIPALAWPAFTLTGWLGSATSNDIDTGSDRP